MSTAPKEIYPYKVGGSLELNHPSYVVRQADKEFYEGLKRGEFCYVLNSRQTGKSSLRVQTMHKLQAEGIACIDIDLTGIVSKQSTEEQWYRDIIKELVSCFQLKVNRRTWWREHDDLSCVHRFSVFVEEVLLAEVTQNIVIFVDEIDSVLSLDFPIDDFFAQIRYFYNKRANKPEYNRLTFALLGVATPSDLIADKNRTPFNIGRAIELYGFQPHEAMPLAQGLVGKVSNPQAVLIEVLEWTRGQPFLSQKLCQLVLTCQLPIPEGSEAEWVENLVRSQVIENWDSQDEQAHLRTIRDRILSNEQRTSRLLGLYQQILQQGEIAADDSSEQMELRLSGLVVKQNSKLRVHNRIYEAVFNQSWVNQQLAKLRPYSEAITAWLKSNQQDKLCLLRGKILSRTLDWAKDKNLSKQDYEFLNASKEQKNKIILWRFINGFSVILFGFSIALLGFTQNLKVSLKVIELEQAGISTLQQFKSGGGELEALLSAMQTGQYLQALVKDGIRLENYPTTSPLLALQVILDNIHKQNQWNSGHGSISSMNFSPDGQHLATTGKDGTVRIWNQSGKLLTRLKGQGLINSLSFSPDGQRIATAGFDGTVRLWSLSGQQLNVLRGYQSGSHLDILKRYEEQRTFGQIRFSADGKFLATVGLKGRVQIWNLLDQKFTLLEDKENQVIDVNFNPDGKTLIAVGSTSETIGLESKVQLWNLSGEKIAQWKVNHPLDPIFPSFSISPDGKYIATNGTNNSAYIWELSGRQVAELKSPQSVTSMSFSPNGQYFATSAADGTVRLWTLSGQQKGEFKSHQRSITSLKFSPNRQQIAVAGYEGIMQIWTFSERHLGELQGHPNGVDNVIFSPDGQYLASVPEDSTVRLWNLSGEQIAELHGHQGLVDRVSFSPNGQQIVTAGEDGTVRLWNLSGEQVAEHQTYPDGVDSLSFSPDGKHLAIVPAKWFSQPLRLYEDKLKRHLIWKNADKVVQIWDLLEQQVTELQGLQDSVTSVSFSPDGQRLATSESDGTLRLWNMSGQQMAILNHQFLVNNISFTPDGRRLAAVGFDGTVRLWNLSGKQLAQLNLEPLRLYRVSFSRDGQFLDVRGSEGTAGIWNLSNKQFSRWKAPESEKGFVDASPDWQWFATSGLDGTARIWDIKGRQLAEWKGDWREKPWRVSFSPDGKHIAIRGENGTVQLWRVRGLDELLEYGCVWLKDYFVTHPEAREKLKVC